MKNIFNLYEESNTLSTIFKLLKVKYTHKYTNRYFNEHPNKYDMFGLSRMLSHFGVNNKGIRITDKENNIYALPPPFIAHVGNGFVVVEAIKNEKVVYHWNEKKLSVPLVEFNNIWSGATLIVETDENSVEPYYKENRKRELVTEILQYLLLGAILILAFIGFVQNRIYNDIGLSLLLVLNIIGIYVGYLLILKQMNIQSSHVDKICSLFSQSDCNNVLDSPAAKFMGIFSWSELGLSYFLSNTFILLFAIQFLPYLVLLNICALPYSLWSVWYQRFKVKQWCPLCLIVQNLNCRLSIDEIRGVVNSKIEENVEYLERMEMAAIEKKDITSDDFVCSICRSSICITETGDVYPCAGWQDYVVGNVKKTLLKDIWDNSEKVQYLRGLRNKDFPKCAQCSDKEYCTICMVRNANENSQGDPLVVSKHFCNIAKLNKQIVSHWKKKLMNA